MKPYDLHNHTSLSPDGAISGKKLIDLAIKNGVKGLGICDHDTFPDESLYKYAKKKGLQLALGIEFSCDKAHIIGYNMKIKKKDREFIEKRRNKMKKDYISASKRLVDGLKKEGIDISYNKIEKFYNKKNPQKLFVLKYLAEKLKLFPSWAEARKHYQNKTYYVKDGQGISKLSPIKIIKLIHDAGGFAIWAHPFMTPESTREEYFKLFHKHGIDAIEASYAYHENGYGGTESNKELEKGIRKKLKKMQIPISGGSDSHFPLKTYANLKSIMPGDFGITQKELEEIKRVFKN
ncbi:PHP domain-containing protein [Candidatus Pacearchaeota archaeon]|nr:PHP domain-containing protein [Candidatus Pacearchaeota archaeon]